MAYHYKSFSDFILKVKIVSFPHTIYIRVKTTSSSHTFMYYPQWHFQAAQKDWETFVYSSAGKLKLILLFIQNKLKFNFKQKTFTLTYEITLSTCK